MDTQETGIYIVFQPESDRPVTRVYGGAKQAEHVAENMALKFRNTKFYVMQEVSCHEVVDIHATS